MGTVTLEKRGKRKATGSQHSELERPLVGVHSPAGRTTKKPLGLGGTEMIRSRGWHGMAPSSHDHEIQIHPNSSKCQAVGELHFLILSSQGVSSPCATLWFGGRARLGHRFFRALGPLRARDGDTVVDAAPEGQNSRSFHEGCSVFNFKLWIPLVTWCRNPMKSIQLETLN